MRPRASSKWRIPRGAGAAFAELQAVPNVGPATAEDLVRLGVRSVRDLKRQAPLALYARLCRLDGVRHDPCVLDVFMSAVAFARTGIRRSWWSYTPERKRQLAKAGAKKPAPARARLRRAKPRR